MGSRLLVASGGGGDAIAAVMIAHAQARGDAVHVATLSWDRLIIDPLPGPRDPSNFLGLRTVGTFNHQVTADTTMCPPAGSSLPRLARELAVSVYLLDPRQGVAGLRRQLDELARLLAVESIEIVDVGGDIVATGEEEALRSPLADSMMLAAARDLGSDVAVLVTGAGLDGELPEDVVLTRCASLAPSPLLRMTAPMLAGFEGVFEWHLSEAAGLLRVAALGVRGQVEVRDHGGVVTMTDRSSEVWRLDAVGVFAINRLAQTLVHSHSLEQAEDALVAHMRPSEIAYERDKAEYIGLRSRLNLPEGLDRLPEVMAAAAERGMHLVTLRRLVEVLSLSRSAVPALASTLRRRDPERCLPPLWAVDAEGIRRLAGARG